MKTEGNILAAFILNLTFSVFEFFGGIVTGSVAIVSDALHDMGDALSIGLSFFLEKKSRRHPDDKYTYGYTRYSVMGSFITTLVLLLGSAVMVYNSVDRIIHPTAVNYNGMIIFAVIGVIVNFCAAFFTRGGSSLNQKAVNLHMLEDVLGWVVVLVGAIVMHFTGLVFIDPVMSVGVSLFILINAVGNLKEIFYVFLEKVPQGIDVLKVKEHVEKINGVLDVHHVHLWSMDGNSNYATLHIVTDSDTYRIKGEIREELSKHGVGHVTVEIESSTEECSHKVCKTEHHPRSEHCHHGHHQH
ncbi:MAG: cation transporter [Clostridia bacterium]|nr:cation transporter [Clostridia bacterium]